MAELLTFSGNEASNLGDPLEQAILSQWAPQKHETDWNMHFRTDQVQGYNRKMACEKLRIN